ncbi:uncharacterized protein LOC118747433 [Rhagoletis pomonella]|uniref:uncharacterized protein LOC118747433 n=1 Tax=Rhagoletis pomonella TaxID=28610 RepID=UPI00177F9569|nr:uncharacterized protein LOC118747433 [Rhagoletis pomonella]
MLSNKFILYITLCCTLCALSHAYPLLELDQQFDNDAAIYFEDEHSWMAGDPALLLARHARSPSLSEESSQENKRGRVELKYEDTPERGREASFKYNHHLMKSDDDSYSIDAYAQGRRNYDWNQNDFQGGLEGHWYFKG